MIILTIFTMKRNKQINKMKRKKIMMNEKQLIENIDYDIINDFVNLQIASRRMQLHFDDFDLFIDNDERVKLRNDITTLIENTNNQYEYYIQQIVNDLI